MRIIAIARMTLHRYTHTPFLYLLGAIFGVVLFASQFFVVITLGEEVHLMLETGLATLMTCGVLFAVFAGAEMFYPEMRNRSLDAMLARPVSLHQVVVGKFLGIISAAVVPFCIIMLIFGLVLLLQKESVQSVIAPALIGVYISICVAASLAMLLSTFLPRTGVIVGSFGLFFLGNLSGYLLRLTDNSLSIKLLYAVIPDYSIFNLSNEIALGKGISPCASLLIIAYGITYIVCSLFIALMIMRARRRYDWL